MVLGAGIVSLMMAGCGTDGASDVGTVPNPTGKVTITAANADRVLASTVGGIGKLAAMIEDLTDNLPGVAVAASKYAIAGSVPVAPKLVIELGSKNCSGGGKITASGVSSSGGSVTFDQCQERGITLNGSAEVSINGSNSYDIRFTNLEAVFSTGSLVLSDAGVSVDGGNIDFKIASGSANVQGILIDVANFELVRDASGILVSGSIRTACMNSEWVDVATTEALRFNGSDALVGGKLLITGNASSLLVEANGDGSISVYLDGALYNTYDSASELPQYNAVCS